MRIAIIGAGNVGRALGNGWAKRGHEVCYGVRDLNDPKYRDLAAKASAEAVADAEIIVVATPWPATEAAVRGLGDFAGRIVIDCTNPPRYGARRARPCGRLHDFGWRTGRAVGAGCGRL